MQKVNMLLLCYRLFGANEYKFYFQNDRNRHKYKQIVR